MSQADAIAGKLREIIPQYEDLIRTSENPVPPLVCAGAYSAMADLCEEIGEDLGDYPPLMELFANPLLMAGLATDAYLRNHNAHVMDLRGQAYDFTAEHLRQLMATA